MADKLAPPRIYIPGWKLCRCSARFYNEIRRVYGRARRGIDILIQSVAADCTGMFLLAKSAVAWPSGALALGCARKGFCVPAAGRLHHRAFGPVSVRAASFALTPVALWYDKLLMDCSNWVSKPPGCVPPPIDDSLEKVRRVLLLCNISKKRNRTRLQLQYRVSKTKFIFPLLLSKLE